jgi:putative addiction module killer protein
MNTILRTETFDKWLRKLKDARGKARIIDRIRSAERGNFSDYHAVGKGIWEMRIHFGPGYRVYYSHIGPEVFILLCGGAKRNQKRDIAKAHEMAKLLEEDE